MPTAKGAEGGKAGSRALDVGMLGHAVAKHLGRVHPLERRPDSAPLVASKAPISVLATQDKAYGLYRIAPGDGGRRPVEQGQEGLRGAIADGPAVPHACKTKPSPGIDTVKALSLG